MALQRGEEPPLPVASPYPCRLLVTDSNQALPVGTEHCFRPTPRMALQRGQEAPTGGLPLYPYRPILTGSGQTLPVGLNTTTRTAS